MNTHCLEQNACLDQLKDANLITILDLQQAFHQIRLKAEDIPKTSACDSKGQFEYRVLSFGLTNTPANIQSLTNHLLALFIGKFCVVYLDDVLIYSKRPEEQA